MGKGKRYYAVQAPFKAIYSDWDDCQSAVDGVSQARFKGFATRAEAVSFMMAGDTWDNQRAHNGGGGGGSGGGSGGANKRKYRSDDSDKDGGGGGGYGRKRRHSSEEDEAMISTQPAVDYYSQSYSQSQFQPQSQSATLFFDGGSRGNPGPSGAGAVLKDNNTGRTIWQGSSFLGNHETNNVAEYNGLILGLQAAKERGVREVIARGDSTLVVNQMAGRWRVEKPHLKPLHRKARQLAKNFDRCRLEYVPREQNREADRLANEAMDRRR